MNIKFSPVKPSEKVSPMRVIITHRGQVYRKCIGLTVSTKFWNQDKQRSSNVKDNETIKSVRLKLESVLNDLSTDEEVRGVLSYDLIRDNIHPGMTIPVVTKIKKAEDTPRKIPTFYEYFDGWASTESGAARQKRCTFTTILELMGPKVSWDDVDSAFYETLVDRMEERGLSINYMGIHIQRLKTMMNSAYKRKYHTNTAYRDFKVKKTAVTNVYLTDEEMERLWEYEPPCPQYAQARDLAYLGFKTAARFSDYSRLTVKNIVNGMIRFSQVKTSGQVVIPCSDRVREILARYGGHAPKMCQQRFNKYIKDICLQCGIRSRVEVVDTRGGVRKHIYKEKWEMVASHTFRRSAIVSLHFAGVPNRQLMLLSGHTTLDSFLKYLCIGREDNAQRLAGLEFFK